ncbi:MAG: hypothetical protein R3A10_05375 [Caldilineaceae bacterium]
MVALAQRASSVIVTLGERGLIWRRNTPDGPGSGALPAFRVPVVDTTKRRRRSTVRWRPV